MTEKELEALDLLQRLNALCRAFVGPPQVTELLWRSIRDAETAVLALAGPRDLRSTGKALVHDGRKIIRRGNANSFCGSDVLACCGRAEKEISPFDEVIYSDTEAYRVNCPSPSSTVHRCPALGQSKTGCCDRFVFELPRTDRLTDDQSQVTCYGEGWPK